jgi:hypothetical protein
MRVHVRLPVLVAVLCAALVAPTTEAQAGPVTGPFHYRLVNLDAALPAGYIFFDPAKVMDDGRVLGTGYRCDEVCVPSVVVYRNGTDTVLADGVVYTANDLGVIAGSVVADPAVFDEQAAIFLGSHTRLIPRLPGEVSSHVTGLTNLGTALVQSDSATAVSYYLYDLRGRVTPIDLGPDQILNMSVNDANLVVGSIQPIGGPARAFRYDPVRRVLTKLDPIGGDPESWGLAINLRGGVLGYSFVAGGLERIGVWRGRTFQPSFVEGTPDIPTISNALLWNRAGLIVITATNDGNNYLVPRPGVRLRLTDLVDGLPAGLRVRGINDAGDLIGFSNTFTVLLQRVR